MDYSRWDDLYDSDEEKKKAKLAEERKRKADYQQALRTRGNKTTGPARPGQASVS